MRPRVQLANGTSVDAPDGVELTRAALEAALGPLAEHEPPPEARHIPLREFRARISPAGKAAIYAAAETTPLVRAWLDDLAAADPVNLDDPMLVYALGWLVEHAGLSPDDAAAARA